MPIQTCFFDMGNVLVYFSHQKMCENVATVCGTSVAAVQELLMGSGLQLQLEAGQISEAEFHSGFQQKLGIQVDIEQLKHAAADIFELNESIVPLIDELRQLSIRLVLLSNTSITHLRFIQQRFEILSAFDALTTSFEVGALKPNDAIYKDALSKANCDPQDCFYTDDIEEYVLKARDLGINAEVYTTTSKTRAVLRNLGVSLS